MKEKILCIHFAKGLVSIDALTIAYIKFRVRK